jgi:hypothetical protein
VGEREGGCCKVPWCDASWEPQAPAAHPECTAAAGLCSTTSTCSTCCLVRQCTAHLRCVLLVHARADLLRHHLVPAVALAFAGCRLDHALHTGYLHGKVRVEWVAVHVLWFAVQVLWCRRQLWAPAAGHPPRT